ncbi:DNA-directed RNA polymerase subunit delta [Ammoniphilus resinae]|uniref:Probable DNA-directed RNA polymerase subunit delta n=1 Tax=Ammoniphilus resinae TaxID=861532 RepID=A0ABS4GUQ0_9BACL|nr:DNA-directed RNA polymerase subunit delta [Ammoniphilus resinae]MBP1933994.1 DNA-directed RNA polymerase subunit delta [Ammoniphilus resinae]
MSKVDHEKWQEVALVDISYEVLDQANKTMNYQDIFKEAARWKGLTDEELLELLPQVFTEMNLDGRFLCMSPSEWGLKKWYTTEQVEESIEALARSKGIDDSDDDYGFDDEEVDDDFTEEDEDFDGDIDEEDLEVDEDEEEEVDLDEETDEDLDEEFEEEEDSEFDGDAGDEEEEYLEEDDLDDDSEKDD